MSRTGDDPAVFGTRHGLTGVPGSKSKKINYTVNGSTTLYSAQDIYSSMSGRSFAISPWAQSALSVPICQ